MASNGRHGVSVESSPVGSDAWQPAGAPHLGDPAGGGEQSGAFVLQGGAGWLVEGNDRGTTGSARLDAGRWVAWTPPCAAVGHSFAIPAASSARDLVAVCVMGGFAYSLSPAAPRGATLGSSWLYVSDDGGASFHAGPELARNGTGSAAATGGPIASPAVGVVFLGRLDSNGRANLIASFDGGAHWSVAYPGEPTFIGFTSPEQGVAIMASTSGATTLVMTFDGGRHWARVAV